MKRALVVWSGPDFHDPEQGAEVVRTLLAEESFDVVVTSDLMALVEPDVGKMDLVVPVVTGGEMDDEKMRTFVAAIKAGTGVAGYHGLATAFRLNYRFHDVTGSYWVSHPGDITSYRVDVTKPDDPIMAGIESFDHHSEQYYFLVDPSVEVLASTTFSGEHAEYAQGRGDAGGL